MIVCFLALMIIGLPIAYNLLITTVVYLLSADLNIVQLAIKMYGGMNSFSFLAVPFFVLTGQLMLRGGLLESLVKFVNVWFGNFKGAIAIVTIGASLLMGSIVGLAVASAASLGVFLIPMMKKEGYSPAYSAAVMSSAASATRFSTYSCSSMSIEIMMSWPSTAGVSSLTPPGMGRPFSPRSAV